MSRKFCFAIITTLLLLANNASAQTTLGFDDFDGGGMFTTRVATPDNSATNGAFPGSIFDVFGITNRTVNFDFSDDTLMNTDFTGLHPTTVADNFFGTEDIENNDNLAGTGTLVYEIDVTGASNLTFSADFAAWGDFEESNDINFITASIDGSTPETILELIVIETDEPETLQTYTYEDGSMGEIKDPMSIQGTLLSNVYQNFSAPISGSGSTLTLTFSFQGNGGNETIAIDNILVEGDAGKGGLVGDVNCDGTVDLLDVAPFVDAVSNQVYDFKADANSDGEDNLLDVAPFVALLGG
ncbi:MAG: hypothetical protein AAGA30_04420 [Planctomycetota bacterium]